ncbi:hypothetical protein GCM10007421_10080 [Halopseudomonas oceani]|nr:hypothetical protein GCM10007421_10080 [Halopseudomonas oceani]
MARSMPARAALLTVTTQTGPGATEPTRVKANIDNHSDSIMHPHYVNRGMLRQIAGCVLKEIARTKKAPYGTLFARSGQGPTATSPQLSGRP